jgi:ABC-type nitrate/sulfonate/bicarbonate transport system substrate-binding protein
MTDLRLGFIPLSDCAPLAVAQELGLFAAEQLEVGLCREASWANVRDKLAAGLLDGAHILAPLALAASMGAGSERVDMIAPLALNLNGSAVTIASHHAEAMRALDPEGMAAVPRTARPLARLIAARRARSEPPLALAVVFPFSMHNYELRYWLAEAGIDPDRDIQLVVAPPPRMAARLRSGAIDGYCVGAPWNAVAEADGYGEVLIRGSQFWRMGPDKAFAVTAGWAQRNPGTLRALTRALLKAAMWADEPANQGELARMLARPQYVDAPEAAVRKSLTDLVFHRGAASFPWRSHAVWFLSQMLRWGQIGPEVDLEALARRVYRPDVYRHAAADLGAAAPLVDEKLEGAHAGPWLLEQATAPIRMGPDAFFDGRLFDAARAKAYAGSFAIGRP